MPKATFSQTAWTFGEVSQRALGRHDVDKPIFRYGAAKIENMLLFKLGGLLYRPGTEYVATVKNSNQARLFKFRYSNIQSYILEVGIGYIRFFANVNGKRGPVVDGSGNIVEVTNTPYLAADLPYIQIANKADVAYFFCPGYPTYKLVRTSATTFTFTIAQFLRGPFLDFNVTTTQISSTSDTGR